MDSRLFKATKLAARLLNQGLTVAKNEEILKRCLRRPLRRRSYDTSSHAESLQGVRR